MSAMARPPSTQYVIKFESTSVAEAGDLAEDLREAILDAHPDVSAERRRDDSNTMDFGATLAVLLGTPAVIAVAKGIQDWLERHQSAKLRIERPDGTVVVENLTGQQAVDLVKYLETTQPE